MRVVQLIDSLNAGGAERIAVNYANSLAKRISFSALVVTRKEGDLLSQIHPTVHYLFLNRKKTIDFKALQNFSNYIKKNKIEIVHAHGSSFFIAFLMKLRFPGLKIIYHEHNGERLKQKWYQNYFLIVSSLFFEQILTVNLEIEKWLKKNLYCKRVDYIPNFAVINRNEKKETFLNGEDGKRIVCLANLRNPKNHLFLLKIFSQITENNWTLHFVGKDYSDPYSVILKEFIVSNNLKNKVFLYNSRQDIHTILSQAEIGVLCSTYEGFPVSILEYGLSQLAVVSTNVGFCKDIIFDNITGLLFDPTDELQFKIKLEQMISNQELRMKLAQNLNKLVHEKYSEDSVMNSLLKYYKS